MFFDLATFTLKDIAQKILSLGSPTKTRHAHFNLANLFAQVDELNDRATALEKTTTRIQGGYDKFRRVDVGAFVNVKSRDDAAAAADASA